MIEQPGRILTGEAGVAELWLFVVAAGFADGPVEALDGQKAERISSIDMREAKSFDFSGVSTP
jgi:hypothetical protein